MPLVEDVQVPFNPATQEKISSSYSTKRYYHETMVSTSNRIRKLWHQMANGENIVEETAKFTFNQQKGIRNRLANIPNDKFKDLDKKLMLIPCSKSSDIEEYKNHLKLSSNLVLLAHEFNQMNSTRKYKFKRYLAKNKVFGNLLSYLQQFNIGFGNFSQSASSPIKKKRGPINEFRKYLIHKETNIFHIDEFRTSRRCWKCGSMNQFKRNLMNRNGRVYSSFSILECASCKIIIDRDINASKNILHILYNYLNNMERPSWLIR